MFLCQCYLSKIRESDDAFTKQTYKVADAESLSKHRSMTEQRNDALNSENRRQIHLAFYKFLIETAC